MLSMVCNCCNNNLLIKSITQPSLSITHETTGHFSTQTAAAVLLSLPLLIVYPSSHPAGVVRDMIIVVQSKCLIASFRRYLP